MTTVKGAILEPVTIRTAGSNDLEQINRVVEAAFMTWDLPERVKRLSLPTYLYNDLDLQHLQLLVAEEGGAMVGVAALEAAEAQDCPAGMTGLLLHGLYVDPPFQGKGIGGQLLAAAKAHGRSEGYDGLLVKAQTEAIGFYRTNGFASLPVENEARDFQKRFWKPLL